MGKTKPPDCVSHQIFLPNEVHKKVTTLAKYGEADSLIVECVIEAIEPRWKQWIAQEYGKVTKDAQNESGQAKIRRGSRKNA